MRPVNDEDVLRDLDQRMQGWGNGERLARVIGVDSAHLRSMRSGTQPPSKKVAEALGWELRWVKIPGSENCGQKDTEGRPIQ